MFKNLLFITKYNTLKIHEKKKWIYVLIYMAIYFSIEFLTGVFNIPFAIWDTALTSVILILVFIFGNFFCGKACFLSRLQDGIDIVGRFVFRRKYDYFIGQKVRNRLKMLRYFFMAAIVAIPLLTRSYDNFLSMFGLFFNLGFFFCLIESHAYCKYFCFVGALSKLSSLKNEKRLIRNIEKCTECQICSEICLMDCDPGRKSDAINHDLWCTSCYRCKAVCPVKAIEMEK